MNEGQRVSFKIGNTNGIGIVRGISQMEQVTIGKTYIVEIVSGADKKIYPYSCFSIAEVLLTKLD